MFNSVARLSVWAAAPIVLVIVAAGLPFISSVSTVYLLSRVVITALAIASVSLLYTYTGLITVGQAALQGVGSYAAIIAMRSAGIPELPAILIGGVVAALLGLILAVASVQLRGPYFTVLTLGVAGAVPEVILLAPGITGGSGGIAIQQFTLSNLIPEVATYWLVLAVAVVCFALIAFLRRSATVPMLLLSNGSAAAARTLGANVIGLRVLTVTICNTLVGISGALLALTTTFVTPNSFPFSQSVLFLAGAIIGGTASLWGSVIGGLLVVLIPQWLAADSTAAQLILGAGMAVTIMVIPGGLAGIPNKVLAALRTRAPALPTVSASPHVESLSGEE